jgi:predicted kinase
MPPVEPFTALCPAPPRWSLDWAAIRDAFAFLRALEGVAQDPVHHAEGDVATHTRLATEALVALPAWRARPAGERVRLFAAVLLHDAAKAWTTRRDGDGRITAHGHSRGGDLHARRLLWELGAPVDWREHVAALVRHHQVPFWALERPDLDAIAFRVSLLARNDDLAMLAVADITGRVSADTARVLDAIALFEEYCAERRCLDRPRAFASDHARFSWFRHPNRDPDWAAYDDTEGTVTVMSGLPGAGKDTWVHSYRDGQPVVSLDALRVSMGAAPTGAQGAVLAAAREQAREHLRAGRDFVWNATNVSRQMRSACIALAADYHSRVEIVSVEASPAALRARNAERDTPVPAPVVDRLADRWETPDVTEAHRVSWVVTG